MPLWNTPVHNGRGKKWLYSLHRRSLLFIELPTGRNESPRKTKEKAAVSGDCSSFVLELLAYRDQTQRTGRLYRDDRSYTVSIRITRLLQQEPKETERWFGDYSKSFSLELLAFATTANERQAIVPMKKFRALSVSCSPALPNGGRGEQVTNCEMVGIPFSLTASLCLWC